MKKFLAIIILSLCFIISSQADDIRDFQIERMSLGDSLLDRFSKKEMNNKQKIYHYATKDYYQVLIDENIEMYDAPVGRLVSNAIDGTLLIMVGGNKNNYSKIEKILNCMGSDVIYCGKAGSGSTMKIINNYMSIVSNIVTAETLSLVDKSGINRELAIKLMSSTAAGKGHMNLTYPAKVFKNDVAPGFKNLLALKDLKLAINHAEKEGIDLVSGKGVLKTYEAAVEGKYKDLDWTAMFNYIKEINHLD